MTKVCTEEKSFLDRIDEQPDDFTNIAVFADWLQDRDDPRWMGYAVIAKWRIQPHYFSESNNWGFYNWMSSHFRWLLTEGCVLDPAWFSMIPTSRHVINNGWGVIHTPSKSLHHRYGPRVLLKAVVAGFMKLSPARQAELLEKGPKP